MNCPSVRLSVRPSLCTVTVPVPNARIKGTENQKLTRKCVACDTVNSQISQLRTFVSLPATGCRCSHLLLCYVGLDFTTSTNFSGSQSDGCEVQDCQLRTSSDVEQIT